MRIFLESYDGAGMTEFTGAVAASDPITVMRTLNTTPTCKAGFDLGDASLSAPIRMSRVIVVDEANNALFTGYVTRDPVTDSDGVTHVECAGDEWVLDQAGSSAVANSFAQGVGDLVAALTARQGEGLVSVSGTSAAGVVGVFVPGVATFSEATGAAASAGDSAYRVLGGSLSLATIGSTVHALNAKLPADGIVSVAMSRSAGIANDVTVSGMLEPAAYVTEVFRGDGATTTFQLGGVPFHADAATLVDDAFEGSGFDAATWNAHDPGSYLSVTAAGLTSSGGNGFDGQTRLTLANDVEMAGTLVAEASGLIPGAGCDGVVCGFFSGAVTIANCVAGVRIRQSSGSSVAFGLVNGMETGSAVSLIAGHAYTFRVRVHAEESNRFLQTFYTHPAGVETAFGGGVVDSPLQVVCEMRDEGLASSTATTLLCEGTVAAGPASCTFAAVDSIHLTSTMRTVRLQRDGSAWLVRRDADGTERTGLIGSTGEGLDCSLSTNGLLTFFDGRVPAAGESLLVTYRGSRRSVGRVQDAASISDTTMLTGLPGLSRWSGTVVKPVARSSADCEMAAKALLSIANDHDAALMGVCSANGLHSDVWPGDALDLDRDGTAQRVIVRSVTLTDGHSKTESMDASIHFANEWAESLSLKTSRTIAADADAIDPWTSANAPLENLPALKVVSVSDTALEIDTGVVPPMGGGFEVRRRDAGFGSAEDVDLVLRSAVRDFTIPRLTQQEMYAVRMYDASTPRRYSRFSSVVRLSVPTA